MDSRHGERWSTEEIHELVERVRAGVVPSELARIHGRTDNAIQATLFRLLPEQLRPVSRSGSWRVFAETVRSSPADCDWWSRYTDARVRGRANAQSEQTGVALPADRRFVEPAVPAAVTQRGEANPDTSTSVAEDLDTWAANRDSVSLDIDLGAVVTEAISSLSDPRLRFIMQRRIGVLDEEPTTLDSIADVLCLSRERVRQLQNTAVTRLTSRYFRESSSTIASLTAVFDQLGSDVSDGVLALRLLDAIDDTFRCNRVWLLNVLARLGGFPSKRAGQLAALGRELREASAAHQRQQAKALAQIDVSDRIVEGWVRDAVWPPSGLGTPEEPGTSMRRRPDQGALGVHGSFYSHKRGVDVYFESQLEKDAFCVAELSTCVSTYQEQPCAIPYRLNGKVCAYHPDLLLTLTDGRVLLIEVKPLWQIALTANRIKASAGRLYAAQRGWGWLSVADRGRTHRDLHGRFISPSMRSTLDHALSSGPLNWGGMQQLRLATPIAGLDVAAYAYQEGALLDLMPYELARGTVQTTAAANVDSIEARVHAPHAGRWSRCGGHL
ncbi:TnsA endonuclease N-terminal domain-containing protein [Rhodococcus jostii]|uniref:TnsA endonuclease N terminal n=1 Tax=Rhodococcus jostii TaxID=132919 RepID=A0A1H4IPS7_RHOJO|nr:TnsA endonuclease N-terminal domain-containing protein [Rhodococcus jostii]SEB35875.1 TnsA endonuclease N terminal [Rhodococcus jostii]